MRALSLSALLLLLCINSCWSSEAVITDGDTLVLDGTSFRLDGIDAPEPDQVCLDEDNAVWPCGLEAREELKTLTKGHDVHCDNKGRDWSYPTRFIGVCWIEGETTSLNQMLVLAGWALNFEPYAKGRFKIDEETAREEHRGIWTGCFATPRDMRSWSKKTAALLGPSCSQDADA